MVNVTSSNFEYYIVPMDKVSVNGEIVGASTAPVQALLDTGGSQFSIRRVRTPSSLEVFHDPMARYYVLVWTV
jgi:hypothetical protein